MGDEERPASPLAIALFGLFDMRLHGCPLPRLHSQKTRWLLALLALQAERAVERAWLARTLWPESAEPQAAFNLRRNLWYLRQSLGPEAGRLEAPTTGTLRLNMVGAEADLLLFDEAICRGDAPSLERAVALHRGPLLQGCGEEWILPERAAREEAYLQALETQAAHASARGEHGAAVRYLRRVAVADPLRDSAQRALMQALAATGDLAAATQVYRDFRLLLHRELNAAPDPETLDTFQQIQAEVRERAARGSEGSARRNAQGATRGRDRLLSSVAPCALRLALSPSAEPGVDRSTRAPSAASTRLPRPLTRLVGRGRRSGRCARGWPPSGW